ncbi:hypothetical protein SSP35_14_01030 [Streptomyces sp. NBRC 110611]|nr:hypothetical protein SSP35_14_01030 [Streptomyces sp. NBRC 110611]
MPATSNAYSVGAERAEAAEPVDRNPGGHGSLPTFLAELPTKRPDTWDLNRGRSRSAHMPRTGRPIMRITGPDLASTLALPTARRTSSPHRQMPAKITVQCPAAKVSRV